MQKTTKRHRRKRVRSRSAAQLDRLLLFARNFVKHPRMLGSFVPSSRYLIRQILAEIDFDRAHVIVEYGPGVGPITRALLRRMRSAAHLVALERNPELADYLRHTFRDKRLHVLTESAEHAGAALERLGLSRADYVISGIPFSTMPAGERKRVVRATRAVLEKDGAFLVYQFSRAVLPELRSAFSEVREEFEPRNIPPARLFYSVP
jgi:phospholipid N-methyltransferase